MVIIVEAYVAPSVVAWYPCDKPELVVVDDVVDVKDDVDAVNDVDVDVEVNEEDVEVVEDVVGRQSPTLVHPFGQSSHVHPQVEP